MKFSYLDSSSTTFTKFFAKDFYVPGNPNSPTAIGRKAREEFTKARERIKEHLGVKGGKVIIGGTASQLVETLFTRKHPLTIGSAFEHDSLHAYIHKEVDTLEKMDIMFKTFGKYHSPMYGVWMLTNNITGTVYNAKEIGRLCHRYGAYYIMDCTASIGHNSLDGDIESYCDCVLTSSHKFHGPSGIGCMWLSDRFANFLRLTDDDHDEYGLIPGTPDVSGAVAMECAMDHAMDWQKHEGYLHFCELLRYLNAELEENDVDFKYVDGLSVNTDAISAIVLPGINADALVTFLSSRGVYISAGHSACAEHDDFRVLEAFGLTKEEASQTVRISFCEDTRLEDIDMLVDGIVSFKEKFIGG